jgi:HPt (histidine-containing phosphotransfer) domain-containing protein
MSDESRSLESLEAKLAKLRDRLIAGFPERLSTMRQAMEAIRAGDPDANEDLRRAAHQLRGVAATYGLAALTALAAEVEEAIRHGEPSDEILRLGSSLTDALEREASAGPSTADGG